MSALPWVRFFPSDWLGGTRGMSASEMGIYISLIAMMYERGEPIAEDFTRLARLCGASNSQFKKTIEQLLTDGKIMRVEGGFWNDRVGKEQSYRLEKSGVGKQAAEKRWQKDKQNQHRNDENAMPTQCDRNANQIPEPDKENPSTPNGVSPPARKRGTRINDFEPDETVGVEIGLSPEQSHREAQKFRDWALGAPGQKGVKQDWPATWRNWARRAFDDLPRQSNSRGQHEQHRTHPQPGSRNDQFREGVRSTLAGRNIRQPVQPSHQGDWPERSADEHPDMLASRSFTLERGEDGVYADRDQHPRRYANIRH